MDRHTKRSSKRQGAFYMRYDTPVYFQTVTPGEYDTKTGNYKPDTVTEVKKYASVTDTGAEMLKMLFGKVKQGSFVIRLQTPYKEPFQRIRIGEAVYTVNLEKLKKRVFIVSELKENGKTES